MCHFGATCQHDVVRFGVGYNMLDKRCILQLKSGLKVHVKVSPNASRNEICGVAEDQNGTFFLRVKITATPEDGKANKALIKFLAKQWGVAPSKIEIVSGENSRRKVLVVSEHIDC